MKFLYPQYLWLLIFILAVTALFIYSRMQRKKIISNFSNSEALKKITINNLNKKRFFSDFFAGLAVFFLIVAILGPVTGYKKAEILKKGVEIVFVLDVSKSMLCEDVKPSRIKRARLEISNLVKNLKGDKAGLVVFAGDAFVLSPLTLDYRGFDLFLENVSPYTFPVGGTNISKALEKAFGLFDEKSSDSKVVIFISDGEKNTGKDLNSLDKKKDIVVFTIGIATEKGGPVPLENKGFLKDEQGNILISKKDDKVLRDVSKKFKGMYFDAQQGFDLKNIYEKQIREKMNLKEFEQKENIENTSSYRLFGLFAFFSMILSFVLRKKINFKILVFLLIFFVPCEGYSKNLKIKGLENYNNKNYEKAYNDWVKEQIENPDDIKLYYNIGNASYKNNDLENAQKNYEKVYESEKAPDDLRFNSLFNLANVHLLKGNYDKSIELYEKYIEKFPQDNDAKKNLTLAKMLKNKKKQEEENKDSKDNENKENNKKSGNNEDSKDSKKSDDKKEEGQNLNKDKNFDKPENEPFKDNPEKKEESDLSKQDKNKDKELSEEKDNKNKPENDNENKEAVSDLNKKENNSPKKFNYEYDLFNKVKDKPMGLIPYYQKKEVEKDW
ncbi:MAG: VWA domain-containing protein [Desulforegulaceae bacterium]|nr:VWA domain-containing protein [Desulforegulaceae bacterium]